jgi:KEOPS complex subunit Pcc1
VGTDTSTSTGTDTDTAADATERSLDHDAVLRFSYARERRARLVARSVRVEIGGIDDDRSTASVTREGREVLVHVRAADLVALRAGLNSWRRLVSVAERVTERDERASRADRTGWTDDAPDDGPA